MTRPMGPGAHAGDLRRAQRAIDQLRSELARVDARSRDAATSAQVSLLQEAVLGLSLTGAATEVAPTEVARDDYGDVVFAADDEYLYASYGQTGGWQAYRWDATSRDTVTGTGTRPTSLAELEALSW